MYPPETIKRLNAEASPEWPERVNQAIVTIKSALKQVVEINQQIRVARQLCDEKPELERQLSLAEAFYRAQRKNLLNLEDPVSILAGILEALNSLEQQYEQERQTLEGRLVVTAQGSATFSWASSYEKQEIQCRLEEVEVKLDNAKTVIREIKEVLSEYSTEFSHDPLNRQAVGYAEPQNGQGEAQNGLAENPCLNV